MAGAILHHGDECPVVSEAAARIEGVVLHYTAEIGRLAIRHVETGEPLGWMGYIAYRVSAGDTDRAAPASPRPLTFVWNGGPGANSSLLHFSAVGPKRLEGARLVDNAESWLSATDLVLVDPIGTGFSRPVTSEHAASFYGTRGDVASVAEFVRAWRLRHDAENAPLFLAGESWGAGRAANVAHVLQARGTNVDGILLISGGWGLDAEPGSATLRRALTVVDMASAALHHGRTPAELGHDVASVRRATERWAREQYAPALEALERGTLEPDARARIAAELARYAGLPAASIDPKTLTISPRQFRTTLLRDTDREAWVFDLRRTAPPEGGAGRAAILRYLRRELGYRTDLPYVGLEDLRQGFAPGGRYPAAVGARWDYATADVTPAEREAAMAAAMASGAGPPRLGAPLPGTAQAIAQNPRLRVFVVAGMYDSFLQCANGSELERSLPGEMRRAIRFKCYVGGHAMYEDDATRAELAQDVRAFVRARPAPVMPPAK